MMRYAPHTLVVAGLTGVNYIMYKSGMDYLVFALSMEAIIGANVMWAARAYRE